MELGHIWRHTVLSLETFPTASFTCICLRSAGPSECDSGMSPREKGPAWHSLPILSLSLFFLTTVWFIYFWLGLVFITSQGLSLGIAGRGCSLVVVWRLLIWWLLTVAHGLLGMQAAVVAALRLGRCSTWDLLLCGTWDLPRRGIEPMYPAMAGQFLTTGPPGKPSAILIHRVLIPFHI